MAKLGDAITKKKVTGRLYLKRRVNGVLEASYLDLGNCVTGGYKPDVQRAEHMKSDNGFKRVDLTLAKTIKPLYSFELDEITPDLERLRHLAAAGAESTQAAGNTVAEVLCNANSKKGRTFFTTKQGLSAVVVKVGVTVKTLNVDYALDAGAGAITILPDSTIADNSTVTVDYTAAEVKTESFTAHSELRVEGDFLFLEKDQFSAVPRARHTWSGEAYVSNWGENNGEDFNKTTLDSIPLTDPVIVVRKD
jgi:hypothetical protein